MRGRPCTGSGSKLPNPVATVRDAWEAVRRVLAAGLVLAVQLDTPPQERVDDAVPASAKAMC